MGMEKYEAYVRRAKSTLTYDPGWSRDNHTGGWRAERPVVDHDRCTNCLICWLYCPDESIDHDTIEINYTYCKGCGLCAAECPVDAISMEREAG
jgi:pyruvate ferredoxin oxidoreductase delta subunit